MINRIKNQEEKITLEIDHFLAKNIPRLIRFFDTAKRVVPGANRWSL